MPDSFYFELGLPEVAPESKGIIQVTINKRQLSEHPVYCPDHDLRMKLTVGPKKNLYYRCPDWATTGCCGTIGAHPDGEPLGWPCDAETKKARQNAHKEFDRIWKYRKKSRHNVYAWMARTMKLPASEAHIGKFDAEQCEQLIQLVRKHFP